MEKLARQVGGRLDAGLAMTGHKNLKLVDHHYSIRLLGAGLFPTDENTFASRRLRAGFLRVQGITFKRNLV
jgi:hypothetical protein